MKNFILILMFLLVLFVGGCRGRIHKTKIIDKVELLELHNEKRAEYNLKPLEMHVELDESAQLHTDWMVETGIFSHTGKNGTNPFDRIKKPFRTAGENIAWGQKNPQEAVEDWMDSPGHRANILHPKYKYVGFGVTEDRRGRLYWCADFTD